ncbi:hypothetical protein QFZ49_002583 [Streptomyces turgidiscabies]|uniref:Transposase n=1 Tax=Streptomyces turgidiscabies TaxID=85558 RepID=A0ABU0RLT6_9ACTN|nr:hypothetical protein [Streptomyces turgidiscabies]
MRKILGEDPAAVVWYGLRTKDPERGTVAAALVRAAAQ